MSTWVYRRYAKQKKPRYYAILKQNTDKKPTQMYDSESLFALFSTITFKNSPSGSIYRKLPLRKKGNNWLNII